jgi:hypothetical protein
VTLNTFFPELRGTMEPPKLQPLLEFAAKVPELATVKEMVSPVELLVLHEPATVLMVAGVS